jgi:integrase
VEQHLLEIKARQEKERQEFGKGYDVNDYVIKHGDGTPIGTNSIDHNFRRLLIKAGLRVIRFHDLRHSVTCLMMQNGTGLKEIQVWMGHSNIKTTADVYAHVDSRGKREAAARIAEVLQDKGEKEDG